ncbi:MAG: phosphopyruvate hydratase [Rhodospirillales bacterium]
MGRGAVEMSSEIVKVIGRRVWDSRGRPTIEAEVRLAGGASGRAIAPAGASTGSGEALDKRDGGDAFGGYDVKAGVAAVQGEISQALYGFDATDQALADRALIELDGTADKSRLGGNALIATSMAIAQAAAAQEGVPLWRYLGPDRADHALPLPEIQIFGGGAHAGRRVDVQDFMVIAVGAKTYEEALDWTAEVYRSAGRIMMVAGLYQGVADEGGFWPAFGSNEEALDYLVRAIEGAGFTPGVDLAISLDIAATDFGKGGRYQLSTDQRTVDSDGLSEMLLGWLERYPIVAIEDPLGEDDPAAMAAFTAAAGDGVEVIADDFICTTASRIEDAAALGACNTALIKPNQAGTLSETKAAFETARAAGWESVVSARSGETEDTTIVHLAVGWGAKQLKVGSFARSERMAKWNEGLRIAESIGPGGGRLPGRDSFPWGHG